MRRKGAVYLSQEDYGGHHADTKDGHPDYANVGQSPVYNETYREEQDEDAPQPDAEHGQYPTQHCAVASSVTKFMPGLLQPYQSVYAQRRPDDSRPTKNPGP